MRNKTVNGIKGKIVKRKHEVKEGLNVFHEISGS